MAKNPVLPLYYNDIVGSTKTWTDEEFGAYMRLLIEQWDKGGLPKDSQRLARLITSMDATWPMIKDKFEEIDGMLKNKRMEEVREEKARHAKKQKENAEKRYQNPAKYIAKVVAKHMPLEGEGEGEGEEGIKILKGVTPAAHNFDDQFRAAFDERTRENYQRIFKEVDVMDELIKYRLKCDNDPDEYKDRDTGGIRNGFQKQLTTAPKKSEKYAKRNTNSAEQIKPGTHYAGSL